MPCHVSPGLTDAALTNPQMAGDNTTFVLIASRDSATIQSQNYLQKDEVKALIMHTSFKDLHENNDMVSSLMPSIVLSVSRLPLSPLFAYSRVV